MDVIEEVPRNVMKMVLEMRELSYRERLEAVNLPILGERKENGDMITFMF